MGGCRIRLPMPLVSTTVRFDEVSYNYIRDEARDADISVAQFIREAAIIRAALRGARRAGPGLALDFASLAEEVERLSRVR